MELVGILRNASSIGYTHAHNNLYTASFELPAPDPQNAICDTHYIVDIYDGNASSGKYRILDEPESDITSNGSFLKYSCEHVIAFLLNDVINGHLEAGGTGNNTRYVIEQLLAMQSVQRWQLGQCDFSFFFQYSWENTNLLDALFSIPKCFENQYHWTYDTSSYPWTLNLVAQSTDRSCEVRKKRNMQFIKRGKDSFALCTRLYCKGSGEGVNQLGIADVNPTGMPYIDSDTIGTYGILSSHFIDLTVNDAVSLYAKGRAILQEVKHPRYTYSAKAADLSKITGLEWDKFDEGKYVRLYDEEKGLDLDAMIVEVSKRDIEGDPLDVDIVISNKPSDVASAIEDLSKRAAIHAQYSQGATNLYSQQYADNADTAHPAVMRFYIPNGAVRINQVLLSWRFSAFRAYETGAASGGGSTATSDAGGGAEKTSRSGGGETTGSNNQLTGIGYAAIQAPASSLTSGPTPDETGSSSSSATGLGGAHSHSVAAVSNNAPTSDPGKHTHTGPSHLHTIESHTHTGPSHAHSGPAHVHTGPSHRHSWSETSGGPSLNTTSSDDGSGGFHSHTMRSHTHSVSGNTSYAGTGNTGESGTGNTGTAGTGNTGGTALSTNNAGTGATGSAGDHTHTFTVKAHDTLGVADHNHGMAHTHSLGAHTHTYSHVHDDEGHQHSLGNHRHSTSAHTHIVDIPEHSHTVSIPSHTHEIIHGIFEGTTAITATIKVDGSVVPSGSVSADEMDIVAWLAKDANGKITRGTWHTVEIIPDTLTRIESNLFIQTFVTSYEGGNY